MSVKVSNETVKKIIGKHIQESINKDNILNCLISVIDSTSMEILVDMCLKDTLYDPFCIGDIVGIKVRAEDININHIDHDLSDGISLRYGILTGSDNYGSEFNPYFYKMKVDKFDLDQDHNIITISDTIYTNELVKIDDEDLISKLKHKNFLYS